MTRICLIEDDPIMGESLSDRFLLEGFTLDWFKRGGQALEALRGHRYDAVISDVRLPDVSGEDVFSSATREVEHVPPFLFITAYASVDRAVDMLKRGAHDYVTKPFDISELVTKVRRAVGAPAATADATDGEVGPLGPSPCGHWRRRRRVSRRRRGPCSLPVKAAPARKSWPATCTRCPIPRAARRS